MNILVTGGTGFIGEYLIPKLLDKKYNITLLVRNIEKAQRLFGNKVNYIIGDVTNKDELINCCENIDIVIHMVAKVGNDLPNNENYLKFYNVNVEGTSNLMKEAQKSNVKKFIYISSIAAMGIVDEKIISEISKCNPVLPYQVTKFEAEQMLLKEYQKNTFPVIILRPTKVYGVGEHEHSFLKQVKLLKKGINLTFGFGNNSISNVNINDFVDAIIKSIDNGIIGNIYIVSSSNSISANEIKEIVSKKFNKKIINIRLPLVITIPLVFVEERIFLLLKKKPIITVQNVKAVSKDRIYSLEKAKKELKYIPRISMERGISDMIDWYLEEKII